jgi:hypothetical protein
MSALPLLSLSNRNAGAKRKIVTAEMHQEVHE